MYGPHMCSEIYWLLQFCQCSVHLSDVDHFVESSVGAAGDLQLVRIIFLAASSLSVSAEVPQMCSSKSSLSIQSVSSGSGGASLQ